MKKIFNLLIATTFIVALSSCSKENKIEKNLWKKGGDWEITQFYSYYGSFNPSVNGGMDPVPYTFNNCGSMHFGKDGNGTITFTIDGTTDSYAFKYSNTEKEMTLIIDGEARVYDLTWSKDVITIEYNSSTTDPDGFLEVDNESFVLVKK